MIPSCLWFCSREFLVSAILDIPIYKSRIQSLHLLFSLYSEFKNSQVRLAERVPSAVVWSVSTPPSWL